MSSDPADPPRRPVREILLYAALGGVLIALLRLIEYRFLVLEHSLEIYGGIVAAVFAAGGVWLGLRLTTPRVVVKRVHVAATPFVRDAERVAALGLTPREIEILEHIAAGMSNREIGERLFVSENTVKTHSSRVFSKLNARRRTEAVDIARREGVIA
jgi:DNA-binding CsgD family transcriptional regulator